jgi:hypothetical protein
MRVGEVDRRPLQSPSLIPDEECLFVLPKPAPWFLRDMIRHDNWDGNLKTVQDAENAVRRDSNAYSTQKIRKFLQNIFQTLQEQTSLHMEIRNLQLSERELEKDQQCLHDSRLIDPRDDMLKIEDRKDHLLEDPYWWILDCKEYKDFADCADSNKRRLLWIKGDAGKGKTMLLIGIIRELSQYLKPNSDSPHLYFFCQGTNSDLNTATSVLRSDLADSCSATVSYFAFTKEV